MKRVLIAEDEQALLELYASVISELGHEVLSAHDGAEALTLARAHLPDLIISDHMMPGMTGLELLREVRGDPALAATPLILVSAARPAGVEDASLFLPKPVTLEAFEASIEDVLREPHGKKEGRANAAPVPGGQDADPNPGRTEMLSWVSHEIKTPLSSAVMNVQLILRELDPQVSARQLKRAEAVMRQLRRMDELVNQVLDAARLADGRTVLQRKPLDLRTLLGDVVGYWRETRPEYEFTLAMPPDEVVVWADGERLRQIFDNLISNAAKYGLPSKRIDVALERNPGRAVASVSDHGPGIDAAELPRIFHRFHRASGSSGEGHGLGLYIAAAVARLHGGTLTARSERGDGATFALALPLAKS